MRDETVFQQPAAAVVRAEGDLVNTRLPVLRARLQELANSGVLHLTLDLERTRMVDSGGIGLLMAAHNSLRKVGGDLKVVNVSKDIFDLFRTMRIHQRFSVSGI